MPKSRRVAAPRVMRAHFSGPNGRRVATPLVRVPKVSVLKVESQSRAKARVHRAEMQQRREAAILRRHGLKGK